MQKQITPAALALSALLLTACAAAPVESVATVETAPEPAPQVLTAYAADGLAPALQAYADAQGVALNWTDDASTASLAGAGPPAGRRPPGCDQRSPAGRSRRPRQYYRECHRPARRPQPVRLLGQRAVC